MMIYREAGYRAVPWKNGGGITREIVRQPATGERFDWRLSLATIERRGPFSAFDGFERTLVLVRGAGVVLSFAGHGEARLSSPGQLTVFDGSWATHAVPVDGACIDLNLLVWRRSLEAQTRCVALREEQMVTSSAAGATVICCVAGSVQIASQSGECVQLQAVDTAVCAPADGALRCRPRLPHSTTIFVACLTPRASGTTAGS